MLHMAVPTMDLTCSTSIIINVIFLKMHFSTF